MARIAERLRAVERRMGDVASPRPADLPGHITMAVRDQSGFVVCWVQPSLLDAQL